jgi:lipopolysaccharide export system permease protein
MTLVIPSSVASRAQSRCHSEATARLGCVLSGFGYFFLSDIASALGSSDAVPVLIAAWAPPISAVLFALGLLLHLEDG